MNGAISENRNSSITPIMSMRNTFLTRVNTMVNAHSLRRCPFCDRYGHNITACNDEGMMIIEANMIDIKRNVKNNENICDQNKYEEFVNELRRSIESSRDVVAEQFANPRANLADILESSRYKYYGMRHCNVTYADNYERWTQKLSVRIFNMTEEEENRTLNALNVPDIMSFNEDDALNYLMDAYDLIDEQHPTQYTSSGLRMLSHIAQVRLEDILNSSVIEPTANAHDEKIEFYLDVKVELDETALKGEVCETHECSICYEEKEMISYIKFNCNHLFCKNCVESTIESREQILRCALCRTDVKKMEMKSKEVYDYIMAKYKSSV